MNKKIPLLITTSLLMCGAVAGSVVAATKRSGNNAIVNANPTTYSLTINRAVQQTKSTNTKYVLTEKGNRIEYYFANCAYDEQIGETDAICMLRSNGSGIYFNTGIQQIISVSITYDSADTIKIFFDEVQGTLTGERVLVNSGDVATPTVTDENIYIGVWSNTDAYVQSITINYTCA